MRQGEEGALGSKVRRSKARWSKARWSHARRLEGVTWPSGGTGASSRHGLRWRAWRGAAWRGAAWSGAAWSGAAWSGAALLFFAVACGGDRATPARTGGTTPEASGEQGDVRAGEVRAAHEHGRVSFPVSCSDEARAHIEEGVTHLHHMMYEQAAPAFAAAARADESCAMAHWGLAMTSFRPLWRPTSDEDLARGKEEVAAAQRLDAPTPREQGYIKAVAAFFAAPAPVVALRPRDHASRLEAWRDAQRTLHELVPDDVDAAAFYALAEISSAQAQSAPGRERDYTRERDAGALLERYFEQHPEHPGLFHYLIHAYDNPTLAPRAESIARRYDRLAPDVPHALHMPSHIFVRTGQWQDAAAWNERSASAALRHPVEGVTSLHYPHALDYMMYAYLQMGDTERAQRTLERVRAIDAVQEDFVSAYGIAAAQARFYLEQRRWAEAASLEPGLPAVLPWEKFPTALALVHYARGLGAARAGDLAQADAERARIDEIVAQLQAEGDVYWASMTKALGNAVEAWRLYERGDEEAGLALMREAADLEDSLDKHPVTPGEVLPVRELYAELLLLEGRPAEALAAFRTSLERTAQRRHALAGVQRAEAALRAGAAQPTPGP